jgi:subtilisin family serine protease
LYRFLPGTRMPLQPMVCRRWFLHVLLLIPLLGLAGCVPQSAPTTMSSEQTAPDSSDSELREIALLKRQFHLAKLGALKWHDAGRRGGGIKVAVLDSGFRGHRQVLGKGLPAQVTARTFRKDRNFEARDSQHGVLCAEVLHAVAPDAEVMLVNWEPDSPQSFLDAVRWAKAEGAKIVTCSLIMPSWSDGEGGGEVHQALRDIVSDQMLFFASAGNTAQRHWCGFHAPVDDGWHQWRDGVLENRLRPLGNDRVAVELYGPTHAPFELAIYHDHTGQLMGRSWLSVDTTKACGRAVVRFEPEAGATYRAKVRCVDAKREAFHLVALGAALEYATARGSVPFPGDGAEVIAVGAVDTVGERLFYSSCGPNSREPKPDFVATVPFPSLCRSQPFTGTSAAAPQAAGLAALLWSNHANASALEIARMLKAAAVDLGPVGHDHETGYGLIRLPR